MHFDLEASHMARNLNTDNIDLFSEIEVCLTRECNLACKSCPHSVKQYRLFNSTKVQHMTVETASIIVDQLIRCEFNGMIDVAGLGEPTMNPHFFDIISQLLRAERASIRIVTNGIKLLDDPDFKDKFLAITNHPNIQVLISVYDSKLYEKFSSISPTFELKQIFFDVKPLGDVTEAFKFNNRAGSVKRVVSATSSTVCYYPFFMLFVHPNGDLQYCPHSWTDSMVEANIYTTAVDAFWKTHTAVRQNMLDGQRANHPTCAECSVVGTLIGKTTFDQYAARGT